MSDKRVKVLIVDDDFISLEVMRAMLSHFQDAEIFTAESGAKAFDTIMQQRPQLVLLDHQLPDLNGVQLYCKVHEQLGDATPLTAMVSGNPPADYAAECQAAGINHWLQKPLAPSDLTELMRIASARQ